MARRPPSITSVVPAAGGGLKVSWTVDEFYADSEAGDSVRIDLNGVPVATADGSDTEAEIEAETVARFPGSLLTVSVSFLWAGSPAEELQTSQVVPRIQDGAGAGNRGVYPATQPVVTVEFVTRRTLGQERRIGIRWSADNYNGGRLFWGPESNPKQFGKAVNPRGTRYGGTFATDQPLAPDTPYCFTVEVRNTLHSPGWLSTGIVVRSAPVTGSVRKFLQWSGRAPGSIAASLGAGAQLRPILLS